METKPQVLLADEAPIAEAEEFRPLLVAGPGTRLSHLPGDRRRAWRRSRSPRSRWPSCTPTWSSTASTSWARTGARRSPRTARSRPPAARVAERRPDQARKPEIDLTVEPSLDSLRLYLRSIGRVELLTADEEVSPGQAHRARRHAGQAADDRGQPAPRRLDRQVLSGPRADLPRPDPGGVAGADPRGGEVRLPPRLQVLHLRDLVDPPGGHARDRRQGPHDPHPRAHGGEAQQGGPRRAPAGAGAGSRAAARGDRLRAGVHRRRGARHPAHRPAAGVAGEADRRGGGVGAGRLRRGQDGRVAVRAGVREPASRERAPGAGRPAAARARGDRDALRADRRQPRTLEEVGRAFNVTRERIRQIENHTLKKLEALPEAQRLRDAS